MLALRDSSRITKPVVTDVAYLYHVSICQHLSAFVSIYQQNLALTVLYVLLAGQLVDHEAGRHRCRVPLPCQNLSAFVSICQHLSSFVSISYERHVSIT